MLPSKLLISLKSADELYSIDGFAFPWIDLKNPSAGSLGCPDRSVASEFIKSASLLLDRRRCRLSVALGELLDESWLPIDSLLADFDYSKVALSRCVDRTDWTTRVDQLAVKLGGGKRLILVHYADYRLAQSPTWQATVETARRLDCKYVLIDTHDKSSGRLWDWYSPADIRTLAADANRNGLQLSIAGSLKIDELSMARSLGASIIGVRSAACQDSSRVDGLCHDRLQALSEMFSKQAVTS